MRYRPDHKPRMRQRILDQAGRLFRRLGYQGVGIDTVMAAANLTRGGFYGYFRSKGDLFARVMCGEHDFVRRMRDRRGETRRELTQEALAIVGGYLDPRNREKVARGCYMASLSVDVARASRAAQEAYTAKLRDLAAEFSRGLPGSRDPDPRALASIALCVGGLIIARAANDERLARDILEACRSAVAAQLA